MLAVIVDIVVCSRDFNFVLTFVPDPVQTPSRPVVTAADWDRVGETACQQLWDGAEEASGWHDSYGRAGHGAAAGVGAVLHHPTL